MRIASCILILGFAANSLTAAELGFHFHGEVMSTPFPDAGFGLLIPSGAQVSGRFVFDSNSTVTHQRNGCFCDGYRQQITGGFFANFTSLDDSGQPVKVHVRSDDYVVEIADDFPDDFPPPNGSIKDTITVRFSDDYTPALAAPIHVAGNTFSAGTFTFSFSADDGTQFSSNALTCLKRPENFPVAVGVLTQPVDQSASPPPPPDVVILGLNLSSFSKGDYDFDGSVNSTDYDQWRDTFGSELDLSGDGNRNGIIDAADYTITRDQRAGSFTVPEPTSSMGWILFPMFIYRFQRRCVSRTGTCDRKR